jgi:hypothetical protein
MSTHAAAGRPKVNGEQVNQETQSKDTQGSGNPKQNSTLKVALCLWFLNPICGFFF